MKSKSLIMLLFCLGFGALAAVAATTVMGSRGDAEVAVVETRPVILANDHLNIKTALTEENCRVEQWPAKLVPEDSVTDLSMLENKFNKFRLSKNMPITREQIAERAFFEQDLIPPGHKVVAVKVNEDDTISGLLKPGQQVDIIGVFELPQKKGSNRRLKTAQTFLKGIRVYSIDGDRDGSAETQNGRRGNSVVGVLVTEKQSEEIVLVQKVGDLKLVLRGESYDEDDEQVADFETLFPGIAGSSTPKKTAFTAPSNDNDDSEIGFSMRLWQGLDSEIHNFDKDGKLRSKGKSKSSRNKPTSVGYKAEAEDTMDLESEGAQDVSEFDDFEEDEYLGVE